MMQAPGASAGSAAEARVALAHEELAGIRHKIGVLVAPLDVECGSKSGDALQVFQRPTSRRAIAGNVELMCPFLQTGVQSVKWLAYESGYTGIWRIPVQQLCVQHVKFRGLYG